MQPIAWHSNTHLHDRRVIARDVAARRRLARSVIRIGADFGLLAFRCSGTHLHFLTVCARSDLGRMAQRLAESLRRGLNLPLGFAPLFVKPVDSQSYLRNAFEYVVANTERHEVSYDPLHEAAMLPDLLGLRLCGADALKLVGEYLPNVTRKNLLGYYSLGQLEPATEAQFLRDSAAAALGLRDLEGRGAESLRARAALVHAAGEGLSASQLAQLAGVSKRSLRRLRARPREPELVRAVQLQVALRQAHAQRLERAGDPLLASEAPAEYGEPGV